MLEVTLSKPSSSNFSVAAGTAADCDRGIPAIDPTLVVVVDVAFPNKLLINLALYAK